MVVTIHFQEAVESVHRRLIVGTMFIRTTQTECVELSSANDECQDTKKGRSSLPVTVLRSDFGAHRGDGKVIAPHFAVISVGQQFGFKGRLVVDTKGVDNAGVLLGNALEAAYPLSAIAHGAHALDAVRTPE